MLLHVLNEKSSDNSRNKATMFNEYFHSVFTQPNKQVDNITQRSPETSRPDLCHIQVTVEEVYKELAKLDTKKATGPDNISPIFLKECSQELKSSLCELINKSLLEGTVPKEWLKSHVTPVFKSKDAQNVQNYRPISLLSIVSKMTERCIYNKIFPLLSDNLHKLQHGFINGRSTCTQLSAFIHNVSSQMDIGEQVDVIYMDFSKAFDSVPHNLLIHKLEIHGIGGSLLQWFKSYLSDRQQRVVLDGHASDWLPVLSGVPQGSILGPFLFLIYINDLPDVVNFSQVALFADDTKLYSKIRNSNDFLKIQHDLNSLYQWSKKWQLSFNASKCKVMSITRSVNPLLFDYLLNGDKLDRIDEIADLGVTLGTKLNWNSHVSNLVNKASRMMGLIKRTVGYSAPVGVKKQLFVSLVRSNLEYCIPVWGGLSKENSRKIEKVQRAATRYILDFPDLNYKERLCQLNLLPLSYRRELSDLNFFFKCINNIYDLPISDYVKFTRDGIVNTRNNSDPVLLCTPKCRTVAFSKTYFNRIVYTWNSLPLHLRMASSPNIFKRGLYQYVFNIMIEKFCPDNICTWTLKCTCPLCI